MAITSICPRSLDFGRSQTDSGVGPGSYDVQFQRKRYRARIPFGSTTRRELWPRQDETEDIGPGTYEPMVVKGNSPAISFGLSSERRYFEDLAKTPGPAAHSSLAKWTRVEQTIHSKDRPSIPQAKEDRTITCSNADIPGPGTYEEKVEHSKRGSAFCASKSPQREPLRSTGTPGPGSYEQVPVVQKKPQQSAVFANHARRTVYDMSQANDATMIGHKAWTFEASKAPFGSKTKREIQFVIPDTPGPGRYDIQEVKRNTKAPGFGSDRPDIIDFKAESPGPGQYETVPRTRSAGGFIPAKRRPPLFEVLPNPSPADYKVMKSEEMAALARSREPGFKHSGERDVLASKQTSPGPGVYNTRTSTVRPARKFAKADRFNEKSYAGTEIPQGPSPAEYVLHEKSIYPGGALGKSNRFTEKKDRTPGPGKYIRAHGTMVQSSFNRMFDPANQRDV